MLEWTLADPDDRSTWPPDRTDILCVAMCVGHADRTGHAWTQWEEGNRYIRLVSGPIGAWGGITSDGWQLLWTPYPFPPGVDGDLWAHPRRKAWAP